MKKFGLLGLTLFAVLFLNGCLYETYWVVSTALTAKTAYNGYETISAMKNLKDKAPLMVHYEQAYVSMNVQPRKEKPDYVDYVSEQVYSRTINAMADEAGVRLICTPYKNAAIQNSPDAVIIQVEEKKPSFWGKIMSGHKIHARVTYIDKKTSKSLAEEDYDGVAGNYEDMIAIMTKAAFGKISGLTESQQGSWTAAIKGLADHKQRYPIITAAEKEVLQKG